MIVDNFYSAATGGQDIMSSRADNPTKSTNHPISKALKGIGIDWVREVNRTYDVGQMRDVLREALTTSEPGPKVIVASSECMLNKQRREKPLAQKAIREGRRVEAPRFGVDEDVCTGDHACIRLSGCPSLSLKTLDDPARRSVAAIDQSCVGCGNCGEVADAAVLCPSFYRADVVHNPSPFESRIARLRARVIAMAPVAPRRPPPVLRGGSVNAPFPHHSPDPRLSGIIKLAIMAVGGQGGGVLTGWIEALARANGYVAQATSVAGVSQRTGATVYYVEMAPPERERRCSR